ncbi:hypothetical protein [Acinetobacter sp.]|uniref:hypothetical protein n=1 Tax=Acinetobacter sp. TaxID=472 RepID=UPI0035B0393B
MIKKIILLSVFATVLTGCMVSPYDDDYPHDGRHHSGQYDNHHRWDGDRNDHPDWRNHNRHDDGHRHWNNENQQ